MRISIALSSSLACMFAMASAFTGPSSQTRSSTGVKNKLTGFVLGPVASNGIEWDDLVPGQERRILPGDTIACYYQGSFTTETGGFFSKEETVVFDQTTEGDPFEFVVGKGNVIKGMDIGILGDLDGDILPMSVGGTRRLKIPSRLAYGPGGAGPIPADQDLSFDIEVLYAGKETGISAEKKLAGYAIAVGAPVVLLLAIYGVLLGGN